MYGEEQEEGAQLIDRIKGKTKEGNQSVMEFTQDNDKDT